MTIPLTTLRSTLATALSNPTVWQVFSFPPATPLANSVIVSPDDPYVTPNNNSHLAISPTAHFKIVMTVPAFDNQGNLAGIENIALGVYGLLAKSGITFNSSGISAPAILSVASGDLLTAELSVQILTSWE